MKRKLLFIGAMIFTLSLFCFVACSSSDDSDGNNTISSNTTPVSDEDSSDDTNTPSGDTTPAVDESVSYSISFDTANFSVHSDSDQTVTWVSGISKYKNSKVTSDDLPSFTVKSGYKLAGWYMDAAHTQEFSPFYITENKRLYAKFTTTSGEAITTYILTYNSEFDVAKPKTTNGLLTKDMVPFYIRGYEKYFCGWFYNQSFTERAMWGDTVTQDTTLYAKWISPSAITPGSGATFEGHEYVSGIDWYTKGEENPDTRSKFTKATNFSQNGSYHACNDLWTFEGAVLYPNMFDRITAVVKNGKITKLNMYGAEGAANNTLPYQVGGTVDMTQRENFIAVKASGAGTVSAVIEKKPDTSVTSPTGVAALVDESGTILAAVKNDTEKETVTLSADVTSAGNVYLIYSRNEDSSGSINIYSIEFITNDENNYSVSASTINSLDLSAEKGTVHINVTGAITTDTLKELAAKLGTSSAHIFLDLSATTGITALTGITKSNDVYNSIFSDSKLVSIVLPDTMSAGSYAFQDCMSLKSVTIGGSYIGTGAFRNCRQLESIVISDSVETISEKVFADCNSLHDVTIGRGVSKISSKVFMNCVSLASLKFNNTSGWYRTTNSSYTEGSSTDLNDESTNATYFKTSYMNYYWYRKIE
ncbi:MAG: leucine-rich repeat protein [Treponema sp.]|nr:leucine-rich repeat protein [Treponema sp.]